MRPNEIVSRDEWLAARKALLAREKETTRALDRLRAERRALPWVRVEKPYGFDTPEGRATLADLFDGPQPARRLPLHARARLRPHLRRLRVPVRPCGRRADAFRARGPFLRRRLAGAARADRAREGAHGLALPLGVVARQRLQLRLRRVVHARAGRARRGRLQLRHDPPTPAEDLHGTSVFAKGEGGEVFHTYSTYARGAELLAGAFNWLDLAPKGRNERSTMDWVRLHDEYNDARAADAACGCAAA